MSESSDGEWYPSAEEQQALHWARCESLLMAVPVALLNLMARPTGIALGTVSFFVPAVATLAPLFVSLVYLGFLPRCVAIVENPEATNAIVVGIAFVLSAGAAAEELLSEDTAETLLHLLQQLTVTLGQRQVSCSPRALDAKMAVDVAVMVPKMLTTQGPWTGRLNARAVVTEVLPILLHGLAIRLLRWRHLRRVQPVPCRQDPLGAQTLGATTSSSDRDGWSEQAHLLRVPAEPLRRVRGGLTVLTDTVSLVQRVVNRRRAARQVVRDQLLGLSLLLRSRAAAGVRLPDAAIHSIALFLGRRPATAARAPGLLDRVAVSDWSGTSSSGESVSTAWHQLQWSIWGPLARHRPPGG